MDGVRVSVGGIRVESGWSLGGVRVVVTIN